MIKKLLSLLLPPPLPLLLLLLPPPAPLLILMLRYFKPNELPRRETLRGVISPSTRKFPSETVASANNGMQIFSTGRYKFSRTRGSRWILKKNKFVEAANFLNCKEEIGEFESRQQHQPPWLCFSVFLSQSRASTELRMVGALSPPTFRFILPFDGSLRR
jgi:hypothetical protein